MIATASDMLVLARVHDGRAPAKALHMHAIGDGEHVRQVVADEHDRQPAIAHAPYQVQHAFALTHAQGGRGFVEDDDVAGERRARATATPWR